MLGIRIIAFLSAMFVAFPVVACETNEIDVFGDGTQCEPAKFFVTTTNLSSGAEVKFSIAATGAFYIDCGQGGQLSIVGTAEQISKNIIHNDTASMSYKCVYSTGGVKILSFAGLATGYSYETTIRFNNNYNIVSLSGSLGAIFPTLGSTGVLQPSFNSSFQGCVSLRTIPAELFSGIIGGKQQMFYYTFSNTRLTSIPEGLFSGINVPAKYIFGGTFSACGFLTSIPDGLFSGITGTHFHGHMFYKTFQNSYSLSGYVPASLFAGLIANGSPQATEIMTGIFTGTNLDTTCPPGTTQFITGYEDYWGGAVSCVDENLTCDVGEYLSAHGYECTQCPANSYCVGGTYPYNETLSQGITSCPSGFSPSGSSSVSDCYPHLLHVGDDVVYVKSTKKTTPSVNIKIGDDIFYINMTTARTRMTKDSTHYFHVDWGDNHYYVCDDTTCPDQ